MIKYKNINKVFPVMSLRLAGELMVRGFVLVRVALDKHNPDRFVYIFNNSQEIVDAANSILADRS